MRARRVAHVRLIAQMKQLHHWFFRLICEVISAFLNAHKFLIAKGYAALFPVSTNRARPSMLQGALFSLKTPITDRFDSSSR